MCALARIQSLNLAKSCSIDWMHCVLSGVMRTLFGLWLSKQNGSLSQQVKFCHIDVISVHGQLL